MKNNMSEDNPIFDIFSDPLPKGVNRLRRSGVQTAADLLNKYNLEDVIAKLKVNAKNNEKEPDESSPGIKHIIAFPKAPSGKQG